MAPGVDGVDNQEVEDMFAGVWGDEGEERAALEAEAGESRGPGRGVKGFGYELLFFSGVLVKCGEEGWSLSKLNWRSVSAMGG